MSAFNTLIAPVECPSCRKVNDFEIQFKFGDTWQHQYRLGDRIKWGGNNIGKPNCAQVIVEAIGGPCPECGTDNVEFDIVLNDDNLDSLSVIGLKRLEFSEKGYQIVKATKLD